MLKRAVNYCTIRALFSDWFFGRIPLPNIASAKKRVRQSEKNRVHNRHLRTRLRTQVKNVLKAIAAGDREAAIAAFIVAVPVIDSIADKGIVHKNKAARHKSRLNAHIKALQASA